MTQAASAAEGTPNLNLKPAIKIRLKYPPSTRLIPFAPFKLDGRHE
jgi:hypothetical protein